MPCVKHMPHLRKYLLATVTYGFASAIPRTWNMHGKYNHTLNGRLYVLPAPITEKCMRVVVKMCLAPVWWPMFLYNDLMRLELYCKGVDSRNYGFDPKWDEF
jgi:hypothetical protein